jgi:GNAT superfamily N-acetyltransferase
MTRRPHGTSAILVRTAKLDDAPVAVAVLRSSIVELCVDNHRNDAATLEAWLANKTELQFARWLADEHRLVMVAEDTGGIRGVGSIHDSGEIRLCYVQPRFQNRGIGHALLTALEAQARAWGLTRIQLSSSPAARAFYERAGYVATGNAVQGFGVSVYYPYERVF